MDVGKSFTFMFEDKDWLVKILIGGVFTLLSVILVGIPFVLGYVLEVIRRVIRQDPEPLPDWDNLGEKFVQGLVLLVIFIIWLIPVWFLACIQTGVSIALANTQGSEGVITAVSLCVSCLSVLWGIVVGLASPAICTRYAVSGQFASAFQFGEIWNFTTKNLVNVIIAVLLSWVAGLIAGFGIILCVVGVFLTTFWSYLVMGHLFGQVYQRAVGAIVPAVE